MTRSDNPQPSLLLTAGDPAGIGPEICVAAAASPQAPPFTVIGDAALLARVAGAAGTGFRIRSVAADEPARSAREHELLVIDQPFAVDVEPGRPDPANAAALLDGLRLGARLCGEQRYAGLVTAPLAKK